MLENLPKELFSSFRIVFVAYILLLLFGVIKNVDFWEFAVVSGILIVLTIIHDDYVRIILNRRAENKNGKFF